MKTFPTISFDTVNRTLLTFYEIGLAGLVEGTGNPKRFDGNMSKHHHFQCIRCKKFFDIQNDVYDMIQIPQKLQGKFHVLRTTVHLEGICDQCKGKE
jgi:Fur family peroxide stress response transcriptional regulator